MRPWFEAVYDLQSDQALETLRLRRFGVIEVASGELKCVRFRPWPKEISLPEAWIAGNWSHRRAHGNRCWLYYNQPWGHTNFLALKYIVSSHGCTLNTFCLSLKVLDEIARLKRTDAIVCHVTNDRITDCYLQRLGWERHLENSSRRHFIKRFYGRYPTYPHCSEAQKTQEKFMEATK